MEALLVPFRLAFESKSPKIIETTLAAAQKLIAHGLIRGDADLPQPSTAAAAAAAAADDVTPSLTPQPSGVLTDPDPAGEKENGAAAAAAAGGGCGQGCPRDAGALRHHPRADSRASFARGSPRG